MLGILALFTPHDGKPKGLSLGIIKIVLEMLAFTLYDEIIIE
jgi:hypothetical protein